MYLNILLIFFFRILLNTSNTSKKKKKKDRIAWIGKKNFFMQKKKQVNGTMYDNQCQINRHYDPFVTL